MPNFTQLVKAKAWELADIKNLVLISRDMENNLVYVGEGRNFPGLFRKAKKIDNSELHWVREDLRLKTENLWK